MITGLDLVNKQALLKKLKLIDTTLSVFILRSFDVTKSGVFSITNGTKVNTEAG